MFATDGPIAVACSIEQKLLRTDAAVAPADRAAGFSGLCSPQRFELWTCRASGQRDGTARPDFFWVITNLTSGIILPVNCLPDYALK